VAVSEVDIYNQALGALGAQATVTSTSEQSTEADALSAHYESVRDELLESTPWPWAHRFSGRLNTLPDTEDSPRPMQQFVYWYKLPADVLRVREADREFSPIRPTEPTPFEQFDDAAQGAVIALDILNPMISYTYRLTDTGRMSPGFVGALKFRLASEVAMKLTANPALQQAMFNAYIRALSMARANITGILPPSEVSTFIAARA
jgi:hypothetical protein